MDDETEQSLFAATREATDRRAWAKHARDLTHLPLLDPALHSLALRALDDARGRAITGEEPFPLVVWSGGAEKTYHGYPLKVSIEEFAQLLEIRSTMLAPKREGWVVEPVTNTDGHRCNESTVAIHALFLDCDGHGYWEHLLHALDERGYAYVAYQSGGYTPETPKWRVVLPLTRPFDANDEKKQATWKKIYNSARIVFGAAARLRNVGFDPATDTPCCPWFLTERRRETDPPRQILWRPGHTLDLLELALALPPIPDEEIPSQTKHVRPTSNALPDDRLTEIIDTLVVATAHIPGGRRALYLSMPGVLLDRGVDPDDVLTICEEVSAQYPRSHPDKHADNLHCAKTTVDRWEATGRVTRIGTLNAVAPEVAKALDAVVPDPGRVEFLQLARRLAHKVAYLGNLPAPDEDSAPDWQVPVDLKMLRKFAVNLRRKKRKASTVKDAIHWVLLDRLLSKRSLVDAADDEIKTELSREDSVHKLTGLLAFKFPRNTPIDAVQAIVQPSLLKMLEAGETVEKWSKTVEQGYLLALASRLEMDDKREKYEKESGELHRKLLLTGHL